MYDTTSPMVVCHLEAHVWILSTAVYAVRNVSCFHILFFAQLLVETVNEWICIQLQIVELLRDRLETRLTSLGLGELVR